MMKAESILRPGLTIFFAAIWLLVVPVHAFAHGLVLGGDDIAIDGGGNTLDGENPPGSVLQCYCDDGWCDNVNRNHYLMGEVVTESCTFGSEPPMPPMPPSWHAASVNDESPHPYPDDYDETWTYTQPGAVKAKVHFSMFDTEPGDFVYFYDKYDNEIARWDGDRGPCYSPEVSGDTIKVRFKTSAAGLKSGLGTKQGTGIEKFNYYDGSGRYLYERNMWIGDTWFKADLGQVVWITVKNLNPIHVTTIVIIPNIGPDQGRALFPLEEHVFEFSSFAIEPLYWTFHVTRLEAPVFQIQYKIESTWVPYVELGVSPTSLDFGYVETTKSFDITNSGEKASIIWHIRCDQPWIHVDKFNGTTVPEATDTITVTVDRTELGEGNHHGTVNISTCGGNKDVDISVEVVPNFFNTSYPRVVSYCRNPTLAPPSWAAECYWPGVGVPKGIGSKDVQVFPGDPERECMSYSRLIKVNYVGPPDLWDNITQVRLAVTVSNKAINDWCNAVCQEPPDFDVTVRYLGHDVDTSSCDARWEAVRSGYRYGTIFTRDGAENGQTYYLNIDKNLLSSTADTYFSLISDLEANDEYYTSCQPDVGWYCTCEATSWVGFHDIEVECEVPLGRKWMRKHPRLKKYLPWSRYLRNKNHYQHGGNPVDDSTGFIERFTNCEKK